MYMHALHGVREAPKRSSFLFDSAALPDFEGVYTVRISNYSGVSKKRGAQCGPQTVGLLL